MYNTNVVYNAIIYNINKHNNCLCITFYKHGLPSALTGDKKKKDEYNYVTIQNGSMSSTRVNMYKYFKWSRSQPN